MATKTQEVAKEDPMDIIEPVFDPVSIDLGNGYVFELKPLSFFGKMEFFSIMGKAVERILSEDVTVSELLSSDPKVPLRGSSSESDEFILMISKVVQYAPDLLLDIYCVILGVNKQERKDTKVYIEENMTDDDGFKILDVFIEQNAELMADFFVKRIPELMSKISSKVQKSDQ